MYSKLGSIPKPETDGTEGWIEVPDAPECPDGKEVVWWYPPGWVVRDPQPGPQWNWSQSEEKWTEPSVESITVTPGTDVMTFGTADVTPTSSENVNP